MHSAGTFDIAAAGQGGGVAQGGCNRGGRGPFADTRTRAAAVPRRGVYVKDLMQFVVKSVPEINSVLAVGKKNRSVGATAMNQARGGRASSGGKGGAAQPRCGAVAP